MRRLGDGSRYRVSWLIISSTMTSNQARASSRSAAESVTIDLVHPRQTRRRLPSRERGVLAPAQHECSRPLSGCFDGLGVAKKAFESSPKVA